MTEEKRNGSVGALLLELGRISNEDVERALEHQRLQGCFFGEALIDLGILDRDELGFSLESRANLPFLVPDIEKIEPEVASLVPSAWAHRHNALPVSRDDGWLTLLIDSPFKSGLADELAQRTGLSIDLALSTPQLIGSAIRKLYGTHKTGSGFDGLISMSAFWSHATSPVADRWGLTCRHDRTSGWIDRDGQVQRYRLVHNWIPFLDHLMSPPVSRILVRKGFHKWRASVRPGQAPGALMVTGLSGPAGDELLFVPAAEDHDSEIILPRATDLACLRRVVSEGPTLIGVMSPQGEAARTLAARMPALLLGEEHRSVLLTRRDYSTLNSTLVVKQTEIGNPRELIAFLQQSALDAIGVEFSPSWQLDFPEAEDGLDTQLSSAELCAVDDSVRQHLHGLAPVVIYLAEAHPDAEILPDEIDWVLYTDSDDAPEWKLRKS